MALQSSKQQKQNEKIIMEFQALRNEQKNLANSLSTLEMDLKEHKTVIDTLLTTDGNRKCFRLIGGILCERTVKDVLPQLIENKAYLEKSIVLVAEKLTSKGIEINKFIRENNIKFPGQGETISINEQKADLGKLGEEAKSNINVLAS